MYNIHIYIYIYIYIYIHLTYAPNHVVHIHNGSNGIVEARRALMFCELYRINSLTCRGQTFCV